SSGKARFKAVFYVGVCPSQLDLCKSRGGELGGQSFPKFIREAVVCDVHSCKIQAAWNKASRTNSLQDFFGILSRHQVFAKLLHFHCHNYFPITSLFCILLKSVVFSTTISIATIVPF